MEMLKIIPQYTEAKNAERGKLNAEDLRKMWRNALIFLTPTITIYAAQLLASLNNSGVLAVSDFKPNNQVIGAFEGYLISAVLDYLKKLNDGRDPDRER